MTNDDKVFVKITNEDIYKEIKDMKKLNMEQHQEMILHQKETNGKVRNNIESISRLWWSVGILVTLILSLISYTALS